MTKKLSILIPAFNEENTIKLILEKIRLVELAGDIQKEVLVIDDCSTDQTFSNVSDFQKANPDFDLKIHALEMNQGKGNAVCLGIELCSGDYILVQDADLEYDPENYNDLLKPILQGHADVVYGSRFMGGKPHRVLFFLHTIGNKILTFTSNLLSGLNLTDMETCFKLVRADLVKDINLREKRFGFEPEFTARIAKIPDVRIYEVGISYYGRTYKEGKKINWKDGLRAFYCIVRYNLFTKSITNKRS